MSKREACRGGERCILEATSASDPEAIGKVAILNGTAFTIVGVAPPEFFGERVRRPARYWVPLNFQPQIEQRPSF